jgi:MFS family permease
MADRRRWTILAVGTLAQAATSATVYGMPMLVPALRSQEHLSLVGASWVVSAPILGILLTLIAWGAAADKYGERIVITIGVGLAAGFQAAAAFAPGAVSLGLLMVCAGAAAGSVNAASGRVVMGWFPVTERGLAMGVRQTALPLGLSVAALALPPLARAYGPHLALLFPAALCALAAAAVWLLVADPPRSDAAGWAAQRSPYRGSNTLGRIHLASSLLVIPQFAVAAFALAFLVGQRHWDPVRAGQLIFIGNVFGAFGRVGSGVWSDRVGSRLRPIRQLAVASAALMLVIALGARWQVGWVAVALVAALVVTVADNGLGYTAVAEVAGSSWSGRALGVQNTVQNLASVVTAPVLAVVIGAFGYPWAFAVTAIPALLAVAATPVRADPVLV